MIADTTFISDLLRERERGRPGPAAAFLAAHRARPLKTTIITAGEIAVLFPSSLAAWDWLGSRWEILPLHAGIAQRAADIDRALIAAGARLGENDNWIAGFAAFYQMPLVSHDAAFDRVPGLRRLAYQRSA